LRLVDWTGRSALLYSAKLNKSCPGQFDLANAVLANMLFNSFIGTRLLRSMY
jgi:hypothetical protein